MKQGSLLKREGMAKVASRNADFLRHARLLALRYAGENLTVTSDDVRRLWDGRSGWYNGPQPSHRNAWGNLFNDPRFEWTGRYTTSTRPEAHGRPIKVWRLSCDD